LIRRLLFLHGIAILMVPLHHASAYGLQAMYLWTDRYRDVTVPNFDMIGTMPYLITTVIRQLDTFAVPAFFFISGFYITFLGRSENSKFSLKAVLPRIKVLIIPFVLWTILRFVLIMRPPTSLDEILNPYFFIPMLIQFYILSPMLLRVAQKNWKLLIYTAAVLHIIIVSVRYPQLIGINFLGEEFTLNIFPLWLFLAQPFWFPLGIVTGLHIERIKEPLFRLRWVLLTGSIVLGIIAVGEYLYFDHLIGEDWIGPTFGGLSRSLYIFAIIFCIIAFDNTIFPLTKRIAYVGSRSLGIYLANIPFIYVIAVLMYYFTPQILGNQLVYQSILFLAGLAGPLLLMELILRTPIRKGYRYLFG
jgi:probable poly-beta-1,6-N-acetyl-D-glucosamine export protein